MPKKLTELDGFDERNAAILAEMLVDLQTSEAVRLQIINELNEQSKTSDFFEAMFNEMLSLGECPGCGHQNHWLVPEDKLNTFGWVSSTNDSRVKAHTVEADCPDYMEACSKKKVTM
jgi:hypothetical protein